MSDLCHVCGERAEYGGNWIANGSVQSKATCTEHRAYLAPDSCDCETCLERGAPCHSDCDAGEECDGCAEAKEYRSETEDMINEAMGRR
jgi:hypothetical protein